ncbi:collagen binding domain-containing protein [Nocardioides sp. zg-DK7169]|uniref:MSCRAMM family protein n=1 Tax=Nocardioides sp. zg-DK7169 TaxID=2736600 RepID=UPI0015537626|nr:carboxypeptidase-like regulatory domain-containing protein [Nocardioides sp. zg-DK7169]NPC98831.1 hypothetical protein [Nocardioides sp. zg-DK7169]
MGNLQARRASVLLALVALVAALMIAIATPAPTAGAASSTGTVRGQITGPQQTAPPLKMLWFTQDWRYLGQKKVRYGIYTINLAPGTYHLQFVDQRPSYDLTKYAPGDVTVTVRAGRTVQANVHLARGAGITGVARGGGKVLPGAKVVAANAGEQSFETKANAKGEFAIGGLPAGRYSVFTWDRRGTWVDKSAWAGGLKRGQVRNVSPRLRTRGGTLLVDLRFGQAAGAKVRQRVTVTVVSKASGQWWSARSRGDGTVTFHGLYPGRYRMVAPGVGSYLPQDGQVRGARVRPGRADLASTFVWTKRGAWVSGTVVDGADGAYPMTGVQVLLFGRDGTRLGETRTSGSGRFSFSGQLTTQTGLTVVALPREGDNGWQQGVEWCMFTRAQRGPFAVTTGRGTELGLVALPRSTHRDQPARCLPTPPAAPEPEPEPEPEPVPAPDGAPVS